MLKVLFELVRAYVRFIFKQHDSILRSNIAIEESSFISSDLIVNEEILSWFSFSNLLLNVKLATIKIADLLLIGRIKMVVLYVAHTCQLINGHIEMEYSYLTHNKCSQLIGCHVWNLFNLR